MVLNLNNGVVGYPYRSGRLMGMFMEIEMSDLDEVDKEELDSLREALSKSANMRDDNHVCYQIVGGPAIMFTDTYICIGVSVFKENW